MKFTTKTVKIDTLHTFNLTNVNRLINSPLCSRRKSTKIWNKNLLLTPETNNRVINTVLVNKQHWQFFLVQYNTGSFYEKSYHTLNSYLLNQSQPLLWYSFNVLTLWRYFNASFLLTFNLLKTTYLSSASTQFHTPRPKVLHNWRTRHTKYL